MDATNNTDRVAAAAARQKRLSEAHARIGSPDFTDEDWYAVAEQRIGYVPPEQHRAFVDSMVKEFGDERGVATHDGLEACRRRLYRMAGLISAVKATTEQPKLAQRLTLESIGDSSVVVVDDPKRPGVCSVHVGFDARLVEMTAAQAQKKANALASALVDSSQHEVKDRLSAALEVDGAGQTLRGMVELLIIDRDRWRTKAMADAVVDNLTKADDADTPDWVRGIRRAQLAPNQWWIDGTSKGAPPLFVVSCAFYEGLVRVAEASGLSRSISIEWLTANYRPVAIGLGEAPPKDSWWAGPDGKLRAVRTTTHAEVFFHDGTTAKLKTIAELSPQRPPGAAP